MLLMMFKHCLWLNEQFFLKQLTNACFSKMKMRGEPKQNEDKPLSESINSLIGKWCQIQGSKCVLQELCNNSKRSNPSYLNIHGIQSLYIAILWLLAAPIIVGIFCICASNDFNLLMALGGLLEREQCLVSKPTWLSERLTTLPAADCHSLCQGLREIPAVEKITPSEFIAKYAYNGRPLLIHNATDGWKASESFNLPFLKEVFRPHAEKLAEKLSFSLIESNEKLSPEDTRLLEMCQFFPYRTEFTNLAEFLNISEARSLAHDYYVGWSNCFKEAVDYLRHHYSWPNFLPADSEASKIDWIFMGGTNKKTGDGAPVHLDFIDRPSWQAVVTGAKKWLLYPPGECENVCLAEYVVEMEKGDLLVVDTSLWYHATKAYPDILTIAIGSEFD